MSEPSIKKSKRSIHEIDDVDNKCGENDDISMDDNIPENPVLDDETLTFPLDDDVSDMLDEVEINGQFPLVTDRYFTAYYKVDVQVPNDDICLRIHSNRICMLSLAPSHIILQKEITGINFKISEKVDRTLNKVSGKGKHGAQPLQSNSNICAITCSDGQTYMIKCCINGKLVEVNERLIENLQLLKEPPHKGGYLAIILPNLKHLEDTRDSLLTQQEYNLVISNRQVDDKSNIPHNTANIVNGNTPMVKEEK